MTANEFMHEWVMGMACFEGHSSEEITHATFSSELVTALMGAFALHREDLENEALEKKIEKDN